MFYATPAPPDLAPVIQYTLRCPTCGHRETVTAAGNITPPSELPAACLPLCGRCAARLAPRMVVAG